MDTRTSRDSAAVLSASSCAGVPLEVPAASLITERIFVAAVVYGLGSWLCGVVRIVVWICKSLVRDPLQFFETLWEHSQRIVVLLSFFLVYI